MSSPALELGSRSNGQCQGRQPRQSVNPFFLLLTSEPTLKQIFSPSLKETLRFSLKVLRLRLVTMKFSPVSHSTITEDTYVANVQVIFLHVLLSFYLLQILFFLRVILSFWSFKSLFIQFWFHLHDYVQTFPPAVLGSRQAFVSRKAFATFTKINLMESFGHRMR